MLASGPVMIGATGRHRRSLPVLAATVPLAASAALLSLAAWLIVSRRPLLAGICALGAAVALLAAMAATRRATRIGSLPLPMHRAAFGTLVLDQVFDLTILGTLAWAARNTRVAALALVALGTSYTAAYARARARSLEYGGRETLQYRAVRGALLTGGLLTDWVEPFLAAFVVVATAAAAVRGWGVAREDERARAAGRSR